jgi:hypothetical protein
VILLEQLCVKSEGTFVENLLEILEHALAYPRDGEDFFRIGDYLRDLLRIAFDGFGGVAVGAYAEGVVAIDFHKIGGFVQDGGDVLVVNDSIVHAEFPKRF